MTIDDFIKAKSADFDMYKYRMEWNGYKVYSIWLKTNEGACVGYPQYALEKDGKIRVSTLTETLEIMAEIKNARNK
nr:MAG TPA: hypothetical protein [Caudoviricetes sp.]